MNRTFDSLTAAARALSVPVQKLKRLKRQGAAGFRGGRVYEGELLAWLKANPSQPKPATTTPTAPVDIGPDASLLRLRQQEAQTYAEMMRTGDPGDRDAWLAIVTALHRSELARREADATFHAKWMARDSARRAVQEATADLFENIRKFLLEDAPAQLCGLSQAQINERARPLFYGWCDAMRTAMEAATAANSKEAE